MGPGRTRHAAPVDSHPKAFALSVALAPVHAALLFTPLQTAPLPPMAPPTPATPPQAEPRRLPLRAPPGHPHHPGHRHGGPHRRRRGVCGSAAPLGASPRGLGARQASGGAAGAWGGGGGGGGQAAKQRNPARIARLPSPSLLSPSTKLPAASCLVPPPPRPRRSSWCMLPTSPTPPARCASASGGGTKCTRSSSRKVGSLHLEHASQQLLLLPGSLTAGALSRRCPAGCCRRQGVGARPPRVLHLRPPQGQRGAEPAHVCGVRGEAVLQVGAEPVNGTSHTLLPGSAMPLRRCGQLLPLECRHA